MSNSDAMNSEIRFLEEVEEKLKTRITEINASFLEGEKQIESMHDYYWENYTEMDESMVMKIMIISRHFSEKLMRTMSV